MGWRAGSFQEVDRVPIILQIHEDARIAGMSVHEICTNPEKHVLAQLIAMQQYGHDLPCGLVDSYNIEAEALGCSLTCPDEKSPEIATRALEDKSALEGLRVPDLHRDGRMPWIFEVNELFHEYLGEVLAGRI